MYNYETEMTFMESAPSILRHYVHKRQHIFVNVILHFLGQEVCKLIKLIDLSQQV